MSIQFRERQNFEKYLVTSPFVPVGWHRDFKILEVLDGGIKDTQ